MNMMMQISPALSAVFGTTQELDGLVAGLGQSRPRDGRAPAGRHQRRLNRRRRYQQS